MRGTLFIVSAPSGAGKTTLIQQLIAGRLARQGGLAFSVSHTTRAPRAGEADGVAYHFVDQASFQEMVGRGEFLEWALVHGNLYGTSRREVFPRLERGEDVLLDIDVQGAERVLAQHPEACSVFILPPSYEDLARRLRGRALDGPQEIARRLAVSLWEIKRYVNYSYVIINRDAERASEELAAVILDKRQRRERMEEAAAAVVADFERRAESDRHPG